MFDVFLLALGLGSFWWRWLMRMPANASKENENGIRLYTRRHRCCRLAVLPALRTVAA
jgi:hypothetical protein